MTTPADHLLHEANQDKRIRLRDFRRKLSELCEEYAEVAEHEGRVELDGGLWIIGSIRRGE